MSSAVVRDGMSLAGQEVLECVGVDVRNAALELFDGNLGQAQIHGRVELGFGDLAVANLPDGNRAGGGEPHPCPWREV